MKKYLSVLLITILSISFLTTNVDAQTNTSATGTVTGNGVCSLYPDSCRTDQHLTMDMNWTSADTAFTQNVNNFGWLSAAWAQTSSYQFVNHSTAMTNAVYYVRVKDLGNIHGETFFLTVNDVNMIIGNNSNSGKTGDMSRTIYYSSNQVQEGSNYYSNYTFSPASQMVGGGLNNIFGVNLYAQVAHNNNYYASDEDLLADLTNHTSTHSTYKSKTPGTSESGNIVSSPVGGFADNLPTLYYNPTYDIFEGSVTYQHPQVATLGNGTNAKKLDIQRVVYVRAIFLRGGTTNTWISGLNSPGSLYNANTGLGKESHGVVNQLDLYPRLFTNDQYDWTDGGNGEAPRIASGVWAQPNATNPTTGRIITDKYPSPLYGTNSLAMLLREYDSYYKGGKDILSHHRNSLILYMNVNKVNLDSNKSEFDTYIIFFKDGDYVDMSLEGSKLKIEERLIITGGNIDVYTMHNGSAPITSVDYYDEFGNDLPYGLDEIILLPHVFPVYNEQGLQETYWNAYEAAYNGETTDGQYYLNIYCSVIGFNFLGLDNLYNAEDGYTMLDIFWPGASMSEAAGCESVGINDYGKRVDGGPNVGAYVNTTEGNTIYGQESYNQLDGSSLAEFASTITNLDTTIDGYADTMKGYITTYTSFLQSDYPLMSKQGFLSTAASMKLWIDGLLANTYISPFVDTVLLIVIVIIAIR